MANDILSALLQGGKNFKYSQRGGGGVVDMGDGALDTASGLAKSGTMTPSLYTQLMRQQFSGTKIGDIYGTSDPESQAHYGSASPGYFSPVGYGNSKAQDERDLLGMLEAQNRINNQGTRQANKYSLEKSRGEANIAADLQRRLLQDKFSMLRQLLGGGNQYGNESVTTSGSTQETGGEYHDIGGRPEWMPTSRNIKSSETKTKRGVALEQLLSLLMG